MTYLNTMTMVAMLCCLVAPMAGDGQLNVERDDPVAAQAITTSKNEGDGISPRENEDVRKLLEAVRTGAMKGPDAKAAFEAMDRQQALAGLAYYVDDATVGYVVTAFIDAHYVADKDMVPVVARALRRHTGYWLLAAVRVAAKMDDERLIGPLIEHAIHDDYVETKYIGTRDFPYRYMPVCVAVQRAVYEITKGRSGTSPVRFAEHMFLRPGDAEVLRAWWAEWWEKQQAGNVAAPTTRPAADDPEQGVY